jgi:hypothetical protein
MPAPPFKGQNQPSPGIFGGNWVPEAIQYFPPSENQVSWAGTQFGQGTVQIAPLILPNQVLISAVDLYLSQTYSATAAGSSQNQSLSVSVGIYSNLAGSLQLAVSGSASTLASVTGSTSSVSFNGVKNFPVPMSANLFEGNYWIAIASSTSSAGHAIAAAVSNVIASYAGGRSNYSGVYGASSNVTQQVLFGLGVFSSTTTALPVQMAFSSIIGSGVGNTANPLYALKNYSA